MDFGNEEGGLEHYQVNLKGLLLVGEWMAKMKEAGVFDNTRIIITADHGRRIEQFDHMMLDNGVDVQAVNCLLLVKDYNEDGEFRTDESFMTNADVPAMAVQDVLQDRINPYTGKIIDMSGKENGVDITFSPRFGLVEGTRFDTDDFDWYHVKDNIFDVKNWAKTDPK